MNSLKKAEGVPLLNFEGGPGIPLLNFRAVPGPTLKLWGVPGPRVPRSRGPGPTFTTCPVRHQNIHSSAIQQIEYISTVFTTHFTSVCEKHLAEYICRIYICRISSFYRSSHRSCSAKKVFLKFLQYSQENPCVGVSLQAFSPAILFIRHQQLCFPVNI